ncbi:MAG: UDP-3-O-[3-hydroxymyristoyl] N-acetylglucosamine deacetylase, partial [Verrucomicrobiota bacterium]
MTFHPAPCGTGIRFRRVDLDGRPEIEARVELVIDTNRSTTLGKGSVKIHTVEHVLAAFSGAGVDNVIVDLDANEPPIADGSAREYVRMIEKAGIVPQTEARAPYRITQPIEIQVGETIMQVFPHDRLKISCTSSGSGGRFTQFYSLEVTPETWPKELAHARTFCFFEELEQLYKHGLIKGGSLENAVVIRDDAVLTTEPLRYPEEFVRHKMLDIIGDLSLLGRPLLGHIVAIRPSHTGNCELTRQIAAQMRKPEKAVQTFSPPPAKSAEENPVRDGATLDVMQVMKILPHRPPILMVDCVTKIEGNRIVAQKNVSMSDPVFAGHFPG